MYKTTTELAESYRTEWHSKLTKTTAQVDQSTKTGRRILLRHMRTSSKKIFDRGGFVCRVEGGI